MENRFNYMPNELESQYVIEVNEGREGRATEPRVRDRGDRERAQKGHGNCILFEYNVLAFERFSKALAEAHNILCVF